jgi:Haloacid dehalogenase-like hydrolase
MRVKGLLVDLDGTLYVGDEPIEGAREAIARLKSSGLMLRYVSNTTRKPRRAVREHLRSLGFDVEEAEIFAPARAAAGLIGGKTCFPLVDESLLEDLAGVTLSEDHPDYVLVGDLGEGFTYDRLNAAFRFLMDGAQLIALQKNRYWRKEDGLSLDAGPFVAALEYASGKRGWHQRKSRWSGTMRRRTWPGRRGQDSQGFRSRRASIARERRERLISCSTASPGCRRCLRFESSHLFGHGQRPRRIISLEKLMLTAKTSVSTNLYRKQHARTAYRRTPSSGGS